jgi:hypothetical protein
MSQNNPAPHRASSPSQGRVRTSRGLLAAAAIAGALMTGLLQLPKAAAASGDRDATFGGDRIQTVAFGRGDDVLDVMAVQPDGKIVAAGTANGPLDYYPIVRYIATRQTAIAEASPIASAVRAVCTVSTTANSGAGSLRDAINCANAAVGPDTISFAIPGSGVQTIGLTAALPDITEAVTIDGYTQGSASANTNQVGTGLNTSLKIVITGGSNSPTPWQMRITGGGVTIRGLVINAGGGRNGIRITGPGGNKVEGCFIGTNVSGATASASEGNGIGILILDSPNNVIGGTTAAARNLISGNIGDGIQIFGGASTGNRVEGNLIGTTATGAAGLRNTGNGIAVAGSNNVIGGTTLGAGNVISGNGFTPTTPPSPNFDGVRIHFSAANNRVEGNYIGTDVTGTFAVPNSFYGVIVNSGANPGGNAVGGTTPGAGNLISGNLSDGVYIAGGGGNRAEGNQIGTNAAGTSAIPNGGNGVFILFSANNTVGGTTAARNVISGNTGAGLRVEGTSAGSGATGNLIRGNYVGTDVSGVVALGNAKGILLRDAVNNTIGGISATAGIAPGNLISGNAGTGIEISSSVTTAGSPPEEGDQPERPDGGGPSDQSSLNTIQGNLIGTNVSGTAALANGFGGVAVYHSKINTFGGATAGARNVISGNTGDGVYVTGAAAANNVFSGNLIGRNAANSGPLGNTGHGMLFVSSGPNTIGGGFNSNNANVIAHNALAGVSVVFLAGPSFKKGIILNSIFSNGGLGIDLADNGVTPNDPGDGDTGPNTLQNYPVLTNAVTSSGNTTITGTLNSTPNTAFYLEFFASTEADPSGFGEGQTYLGAISNLTTDASGNAAINAVLTGVPPAGQTFISATATDNAELANTSEFSQTVVLVTGGASPTPTPASGSISGVITYGTTPVGQAAKFVPGVELAAVGSAAADGATNASGAYSLGGLGAGPYTVTPTKLGDVNGVSGLDAARVAQHVAGLIVLTPNQQIAGDATNNGSLSGLDAARIAQTAAGIPNNGIAGQWKFVPTQRSYATVPGALTGENYEAVLVGDVTGNWAPAMRPVAADTDREASYVVAVLTAERERNGTGVKVLKPVDGADAIAVELPARAAAVPGAEVTIPVSIGDTTGRGIVSYDFTLAFDPDVLTPAQIPSDPAGTLSDGWSVAYNTQTRGEIRVTAFGTAGLAGKGVLLNLRFDVSEKSTGTAGLRSTSFALNENEVPSIVWNGTISVDKPLTGTMTKFPSRFGAGRDGNWLSAARSSLADYSSPVKSTFVILPFISWVRGAKR